MRGADGPAWQVEVISATFEGNLVSPPRLDLHLDGNGRPHIVYFNPSTGGLNYASARW